MCWLLQRGEIKHIMWPIGWTKAVVLLKDADKIPAGIIQVGIVCDHLWFALVSFQSTWAILRDVLRVQQIQPFSGFLYNLDLTRNVPQLLRQSRILS